MHKKFILFDNIEIARIEGIADSIYPIICDMDKCMQEFATATFRVAEVIKAFYATNKGGQYRMMEQKSEKFALKLYESSQDLNSIQREIAAYQQKLRVLNDEHGHTEIQGHHVQAFKIDVSDNKSYVTYKQMATLTKEIDNYLAITKRTLKLLLDATNSIGRIWHDPTYERFKQFMREVTADIDLGYKVYNDYNVRLKGKLDVFHRR